MSVKELAQFLIKFIKQSNVVYITAHKNLDLDALGSMVGLALLAERFNKQSYIIIDDTKHEPSVKKALAQLNSLNIIKTKEIIKIADDDLLIITDTNRSNLLQNELLLEMFNKKIILDHHDEDEHTIESDMNLIFSNVSSACELLTLVLEEKNLIPKDSFCATLLLSGIVLDTSNFTLKVNAHTYQAAYYLSKAGADNNQVQYMLKQNLKKYVARQKMLYDIDILFGKYAVSLGSKRYIYRREDLAKIADTLLQFENIEASFVIGYLDKDKIGISARSMGTVDVSLIMQQLDGGGNTTVAATMIKTNDIKTVYKELKKILKNL